MNSVIDLGTEFLIDLSSVTDPYVRLAIHACGQSLVAGSPWIAVNKQLAVLCGLSPRSLNGAEQSLGSDFTFWSSGQKPN